MTTYSFPSITPTNSVITIINNTKTFVSPLTGFTQTTSREGTRWGISMTFDNLQGDNRGILRGFLAQLNGQVHRAEIFDHSYVAARGALGAVVIVDGADQTGNSLTIKDGTGTTNITDFYKAGDYLSYSNGTNKELKMVTADADMVSGVVIVPISPEIHVSPADLAAIDNTNPEGTFMLTEPVVDWSNRPGQQAGAVSPFSSFSIQFVEDIA